MESQEIEIIIRPDGRVEYTVKGVKGSACESISELLERLGKVEHVERTDEYYAEENEQSVVIHEG